jgi:hypothetical protein
VDDLLLAQKNRAKSSSPLEQGEEVLCGPATVAGGRVRRTDVNCVRKCSWFCLVAFSSRELVFEEQENAPGSAAFDAGGRGDVIAAVTDVGHDEA